MPRSTCCPLFAVAALFLLSFAPSAFSQTAIYRFDFEKEGPSLNYGFYEEAWVVADAAGGPASWVMMFRDGPHRRYITVADFGSLFFPNQGKTVVGVVSAAAATGTPQTTFLAIGELSTEIKGANVSAKVPKKMKGYALSADDESSVPFDDDEGNIGYAGISEMEGQLQVTRSKDASTRGLTTAETLAELVAYLERRGYTEFVIATPAAAANNNNANANP